jgi:iron only hydrogenase large subunit-like protein
VWEGANITTNSRRLVDIRKTILELILANHPQDCLYCVRNKTCELQSLAENFGIRASPFHRTVEHVPPVTESETLVRDMNKCVKCGRCVEECQEVQSIRAINTSRRGHSFEISAPYKLALEETSCVFCGKCAEVCPVGAIYGHDNSAEVLASLNDKGRRTIAQVSSALTSALEKELNRDVCAVAGNVTTGKVIAALKLLGFDRVYDAEIAGSIRKSELNRELEERVKNGGKLPMITGVSEGVSLFIKNFYPDLTDHLSGGKSRRRIFAETIKSEYTACEKAEASSITTVSFVPDIAQKYGAGGKTDFALTAAELARMIKLAGIEISSLSEEPFDTIKIELPAGSGAASPQIVSGFAQAREVMEAIRKGGCNAQWIEIKA